MASTIGMNYEHYLYRPVSLRSAFTYRWDSKHAKNPAIYIVFTCWQTCRIYINLRTLINNRKRSMELRCHIALHYLGDCLFRVSRRKFCPKIQIVKITDTRVTYGSLTPYGTTLISHHSSLSSLGKISMVILFTPLILTCAHDALCRTRCLSKKSIPSLG